MTETMLIPVIWPGLRPNGAATPAAAVSPAGALES